MQLVIMPISTYPSTVDQRALDDNSELERDNNIIEWLARRSSADCTVTVRTPMQALKDDGDSQYTSRYARRVAHM